MTHKDRKTEIHEAPADPDELPGCVVYVTQGLPEDKDGFVDLKHGRIVVGTAATCGLKLNDPRVSRAHAEFAVTERGIAVRDLQSTNGTYYLGNQLIEAVLKPGARLRMGTTEIILLPRNERADVEPDEATSYGRLKGVSPKMRQVFSVLRRLEGHDVPVLILGETGTGKELVAQTLHEQSARRDGPFVVLDCGSVPAELVDSELFGHAKGAFTGANHERVGLLEQASGGTLFLDEIGELPIDLQPRLLRALDTKRIRRVGENRYRSIDVRVVAATHRDLGDSIHRGRFREDLFYRLAVVRLTLPALRERPEDIPVLAQVLAAEIGDGDAELPDDVLNLMSAHEWPGNVRELRNVVHQLLALGQWPEGPQGPRRRPAAEVDASLPYKMAKEELLNRFEEAYVSSLLERCGGNISKAARTAGIARRYFKELMHKHGLYETTV